MSVTTIFVDDAAVNVASLEIRRKDVADFLRAVPERDREQVFIQAVEVGAFCLERARSAVDTDFAKRKVESILSDVQLAISAIPGKITEAMLAKIGTGDGQVLAPVRVQIDQAVKESKERIAEVKVLMDEANPDRESSAMGKSIRAIKVLLDPNRTDSVQGTIQSAISQVSATDGVLANTVKAVVMDAIKPLKDEVDGLSKEIRGREAAAEALAQTAQKGISYEEEVLATLQTWARPLGVEVHHVGGDNRPGDVLVKFPRSSIAGTETCLVIEARDRDTAAGRKAISEHLARAMAERGSNAAVFLSHSRDGLGKEIGEWAEGSAEQGPWVACTNEHLLTAVRFLEVLRRLDRFHSASAEIDAASVEAQVRRIRTALDRVATINRKLTMIRGTTDEIRTEAESMRDEVRAAVIEVEAGLRSGGEEGRGAEAAA